MRHLVRKSCGEMFKAEEEVASEWRIKQDKARADTMLQELERCHQAWKDRLERFEQQVGGRLDDLMARNGPKR